MMCAASAMVQVSSTANLTLYTCAAARWARGFLGFISNVRWQTNSLSLVLVSTATMTSLASATWPELAHAPAAPTFKLCGGPGGAARRTTVDPALFRMVDLRQLELSDGSCR